VTAGEPLDRAAVAVSRAARGGLIWMAVAAWITWWRGDPRVLVRTIQATVRANVVAVATSYLLGRDRPCERGGASLIPCPDSPSLPSNHAASAATIMSLAAPTAAPVLLPAAAAVAASRVRVGVHHPSDVVAGAALGTAIALLVRT
jgi:undecaprenyl-diphosphatase